MEMLKNRDDLLETMKDMRVLEIKARDSYNQDAHTFKDSKIVKTFKAIKKEEELHISMIDTIIRIIEDLD